MKKIQDDWEFWQKLMSMLEHQFGSSCEIILHDLTGDYEHTIVDIRNGHITGRKIGGCGSNLGLEIIRGDVQNGDRYNYVVHTPNGKILRSSTMFLHDESGRLIGSLCINLDITQTVAMEGMLHQYNNYIPAAETSQQPEVFAGNVNDILEYLIKQAENLIGKPVSEMNRSDKISFVRFLDEKGAFVISKASEHICSHLHISRFTLYNYLDTVRNSANKPADKET